MGNTIRNSVTIKSEKAEVKLAEYADIVEDYFDTGSICKPIYGTDDLDYEDVTDTNYLEIEEIDSYSMNLISESRTPIQYLLMLFSYLAESDKELVMEIQSEDESVSLEYTVIKMIDEHICISTHRDYEFFDENPDYEDMHPDDLYFKKDDVYERLKSGCYEDIDTDFPDAKYQYPLTLPLNKLS